MSNCNVTLCEKLKGKGRQGNKLIVGRREDYEFLVLAALVVVGMG
jgi:hypothetical protein